MTDLRQAAQQALEALENLYLTLPPESVLAKSLNDRITALREALAQPEQEPICYASINKQGDVCSTLKQRDSWRTVPLYTTPPAAKPQQEPTTWRDMVVVTLVREGINKHRARELADHFSTTPTAQWDKPSVSFNEWWDSDHADPANPFTEGSAAYWAWAGWKAAQRPWQGLTDEDWDEIGDMPDTFDQGVAWAEAKLKERNT